MSTLPLASEFPAATRDSWLKLVEGVLKGADFDKKLVSRTYDGIALQPLSDRRANAAPAGRAAGAAPWLVCQRLDLPDAAQANVQALDDLMSGANALSLVFADSPTTHGFGLKDASRNTLAQVLGQIHLDMGVTLDLEIGMGSVNAGETIAEIAKGKGLAPAQLDIKFGLNPFSILAGGGEHADTPWSEIAPIAGQHVQRLITAGFKGPFAVADGRVVHAAGGSDAQELAFILAAAAAYLRAMEGVGMALDAARSAVYVRLAVDGDQFQSIAKVRALRQLWASLEAACGLAPKPVFVVAETAWRMQTRIDPQVTILRNSVAVFAAAVGGADMITVLPHSAALGLPDSAARRLARNTQVMLAEEANLYRVVDPAAGAGSIEALTADLAAKAWAEFQAIEAAGGLAAVLQSGTFAQGVAKVAAARLKAVGTRKDPLTGASEFPNITEAPVAVLAPLPAASPGNPKGLAPLRLAEPFEALRALADAHAAKGQRPAVFLANLGTVADFTARTIFAKNFYEAGGLAAPTNDGFASQEAMIAAFKTSGARLAVLCSSDAMYAEQAEGAAKALIAAGATVALAGRPGDMEAALRAAGVSQFIFAGAAVIATLKEAQAVSGIA